MANWEKTNLKVIREVFPSRIAGVQHKNNDGVERQKLIRDYCKPGIPLVFIREPENQYDKNAVKIYVLTKKGLIQIGYVTTEAARSVASHIDKSGLATGIIKEVTGGTREKETIGLNIIIVLYDFDE